MARSTKLVIDVFRGKNKVVDGKAPSTVVKKILEKAAEVKRPRFTRIGVTAEWWEAGNRWLVTVKLRREESFTDEVFEVFAGMA